MIFCELKVANLELEKLSEGECEEEWSHIYKLEKQLWNRFRQFSKLIDSKGKFEKFIELLIKSVDSKTWEDVYLIPNLLNNKLITNQSTKLICKGINQIIEEKNLTMNFPEGIFEWNKSSLLESLVKLLNPRLEQDIITQTLNNILSNTDEDDIENYHLIRASNWLLTSIKK